MTEAEYLARLQMRAQEWRDKYPTRAEDLRRLARRALGIPMLMQSDFATKAAAEWEAECLRVLHGWPAMETLVDEELPPPSAAKAAAMKALDLTEYPETGRDRAAGHD